MKGMTIAGSTVPTAVSTVAGETPASDMGEFGVLEPVNRGKAAKSDDTNGSTGTSQPRHPSGESR
jgi:hypothetical protein